MFTIIDSSVLITFYNSMSRKIYQGLLFVISLLIFNLLFLQNSSAIEGEINYTGINTNLSGDDNYAGPLNLGFTFNFYGTDYTTAYVNINGTLNFGSGSSSYSNSAPGLTNSIMPFWDDLITNSGSQTIYYATIGEEGSRMFIVQWTNMYFYSNPSLPMGTFQAILYEGSNNIRIQYRDLLGGSLSQGSSATIGIRNGEYYSTYSSNIVSLSQEQSILYSPLTTTSYDEDSGSSYELVYLIPDNVPVSAVLINPLNGSTNTTVVPTFEWQESVLATSYRLLISTNSSFSGSPINISGITQTNYTLGSPLSYNTTYYWRVESINIHGSSLSGTRVFETSATPNTVPDNPSSIESSVLWDGAYANQINIVDSELSMTLMDDDDEEQIRYRIQISKNAEFSDIVIDYRSIFGNEGTRIYTFGEDSGIYLVGNSTTEMIEGDYYLRIRAEDDSSASSDWVSSSGVAFTFSIVVPTSTPNPTPTNTLVPTIQPSVTSAPLRLQLDTIGNLPVNDDESSFNYPSGKNLTFSGYTEPFALVRITVRSDPKVCEIIAEADGYYSCTFQFIENGIHDVEIIAYTNDDNTIEYPKIVLGIGTTLEETGRSQITSVLLGFFLLLSQIILLKQPISTSYKELKIHFSLNKVL